jgi:hypothetical protein
MREVEVLPGHPVAVDLPIQAAADQRAQQRSQRQPLDPAGGAEHVLRHHELAAVALGVSLLDATDRAAAGVDDLGVRGGARARCPCRAQEPPGRRASTRSASQRSRVHSGVSRPSRSSRTSLPLICCTRPHGMRYAPSAKGTPAARAARQPAGQPRVNPAGQRQAADPQRHDTRRAPRPQPQDDAVHLADRAGRLTVDELAVEEIVREPHRARVRGRAVELAGAPRRLPAPPPAGAARQPDARDGRGRAGRPRPCRLPVHAAVAWWPVGPRRHLSCMAGNE